MPLRVPTELDSKAIAAALEAVLATCQDAQLGYEALAAKVTDEGVSALFSHAAEVRRRHEQELRSLIRDVGTGRSSSPPGPVVDLGTTLGSLHRRWFELLSQLGEPTASRVLAEAERGEAAARRSYESALRVPMPVEVQSRLLDQYATVRGAHETLRTLLDGGSA